MLGRVAIVVVLIAAVLPVTTAGAAPVNVAYAYGDYDDEHDDISGWSAIDGRSLGLAGTDHVSVQTGSDRIVSITTGPDGDFRLVHGMAFAAPVGQTLAIGHYSPAHRDGWEGWQGAAIEATSCNSMTGDFDVRDIHRTAGIVDRLWVTFDYFCNDKGPRFSGEIRIAEPSTSGTPLLLEGVVRWPTVDVGASPPAGGVSLVTGPPAIHVTSAQSNNPAFSAQPVDCSVAPGAGCAATVRFAPPAAGFYEGTIDVGFSNGSHQLVPVEGRAYDGRSRYLLRQDADYLYVGNPERTYDVSSTTDPIDAFVRPFDNSITLRAFGDRSYAVSVVPPAGEQLTTGTYHDTTDGLSGTGPQLVFRLGSPTCGHETGDFTIHELTWNPDGTLATLSADVVGRCTGQTAGLRGMVEYHATGPDRNLPPESAGSTGASDPPGTSVPPGGFVPSHRPTSQTNPTLPQPAGQVPATHPAPKPCRVPRVVGLSLTLARKRITLAGCRVGKLLGASGVTGRQRDHAKVTQQQPARGTKRAHGARITLRLHVSRVTESAR
jgi:hypothetical protein